MRQIGQLEDRGQAHHFTDFLVTQHIDARCEQEGEKWAIWVREEDQVETARDAFGEFLDDPNNPRYASSADEAKQVRAEHRQRAEAAKRQHIVVRKQWQRPALQRTPLVTLLIVVCVIVYLADSGKGWKSPVGQALGFVDRTLLDVAGNDLWTNIRAGELWRVVTPIALHGGVWHIAFNMYWLYYFGVQIERWRGTPYLGFLILAIAVVSNLVQAATSPAPFGGMSGVDYGLLGFIWVRRQVDPNSRLFVSREIFMLMVAFMVLGFTGLLDKVVGAGVANGAHAGGFVAGIVLAGGLQLLAQRRNDREQ